MPRRPTWDNRIVDRGTADPRTLVANPLNFRAHPANQEAALAGALSDLGWIDDVTVNRRTGYILNGHLRVALAVARGVDTVPVKYVDLDPTEEALALAILDPSSELAESDPHAFIALLDTATTTHADLRALLVAEEGKARDLVAFAERAPDLVEVAKALGEETHADAFWPQIRLDVSQDTFDRYTSLMREQPDTLTAEKFDRLLHLVDRDVLEALARREELR